MVQVVCGTSPVGYAARMAERHRWEVHWMTHEVIRDVCPRALQRLAQIATATVHRGHRPDRIVHALHRWTTRYRVSELQESASILVHAWALKPEWAVNQETREGVTTRP